MNRRKPELLKREPTIDDRWCAMAHEAVARDMAKWLKGTVNTQRPINSLTMAEMTVLATVAVNSWIVLMSTREQWQKENATDTTPPPGFA